MSTNDKKQEYIKWYNEKKHIYTACGETVRNLIEKLLIADNAPYHSISFRLKSEDSFIKKCEKDKYDNPTSQIMDLCGLRIITYTNSDIKKIQSILENEFEIDHENSVDKSGTLREDQVGYLSVHYVAEIKSQRLKLTEYSRYKNIKFEIQIRTLLQHAWAEIEHDKNYKFGGELPFEIKRRFYLVAGTLELLDQEFEHLSKDIDAYAEKIKEDITSNHLNEPINSTSLIEYLTIKLNKYGIVNKNFRGHDKEIISELTDFGIKSLGDLDKIITTNILREVDFDKNKSYLGILRDIMIFNDAEKYFEYAWNNHWRRIDEKKYKRLEKLYPNIVNLRITY